MKMRLLNTEFLSEHGGRLPLGAVIDVDDLTAKRWKALGIARQAADSARTYQEEKLERLALLREEEELAAANGEFGQMIVRDGVIPTAEMKPRRGRRGAVAEPSDTDDGEA